MEERAYIYTTNNKCIWCTLYPDKGVIIKVQRKKSNTNLFSDKLLWFAAKHLWWAAHPFMGAQKNWTEYAVQSQHQKAVYFQIKP